MLEFITGITNLAIIISCIPCMLLYRGYRNNAVWIAVFAIIGATSLVGMLMHLLAVGKLALSIILYVTLGCFLGALTFASLTALNKRGVISYLLSAAVFALTFTLLISFKLTQDIFSYVAVIIGALLPVILLFYASLRDLIKNKNKQVWLTFFGVGMVLLLAVLFAFVKFSVPVGQSEFNQGALMHVVIGIFMVFMVLGTRSMLPKRNALEGV